MPIPTPLLQPQDAVDHLKLPITIGGADPQEPDITAKLAAAEAIVLDYVKVTSDTELTDAQLAIVRAAILLQFGELWRYRGDDADGDGAATTAGDLSPTITNLLRRLRMPALA